MRKRKPQEEHPSKLRNRLSLILAFVALVLLLLFVRLVNFVRAAHERFSR